MTPSQDPASQAFPAQARAPDAIAPPIPLPSRPVPAAAPELPRRRRDAILAFLVLLLAFMAASFVARNSDLWFHLGAGRLLAHGHFFRAEDPFSYTADRASWPPPGWLFDLALYGLHALAGGAVLVVLKALLVTALAGLLLRVRRPDGAGWPPIVCTALAVLAMGPRLLLQPACVSYALLGLSFFLLWRPHTSPEHPAPAAVGSKGTSWRHGLLLAVFILWVNVDEWFLLGPLLAALFWLGERLGGARRTPGWLAPAGLAACLLNPQMFHAFALPSELSPVSWFGGLRQDVRFQAQFLSPWHPAHLHAAAELAAAPQAYYALTLLGLLGFVRRPRALRGWRLMVWLPFAVLAAWQARLVPFFAVVAAPIAALTWQDLLAGRAAAAAGRSGAGLAPALGRVALGAGLLSLIILAWPGWLAGYGREERRVGWGIQPDPSLERVTETLHDWRRRGLLLPDEHVFAFSPEAAQYGAWFSPGERYFFDHRYGLFAGSARDYENVCRALAPELAPPGSAARAKDWGQVLRDHRVGVVVVSDRDPQRLFAVLHRLASDPGRWTLLDVAGEALVFGWNEARPAGGFAPVAFDAERLAIGPSDAGDEARLPLSPERGPERLPGRPDLWARFFHAPAPAAWESSTAAAYLHDFDDGEVAQAKERLRVVVGGYAASLVGLHAQPPAAMAAALPVAASRDFLFPRGGANAFVTPDQLGPYFAALGLRSPALPLLAVRAARRAVAADPGDANAWLRLGQAYVLLRDDTCERVGLGGRSPLAQLRTVQIATALEQAVRLDPDLEAAHKELAHLYGERNFLDQALTHLQEERRLSRRAGPRPGESPEDFSYRLGLMDRDLDKLDNYVRERRKEYASASPSLGGERLRQADLALKMGLARQAVDDVLLPCPPDVLGPNGIRMELDLLLLLGRAEEVRGILADPAFVRGKEVLDYYELPAPEGADGAPFYPVPYHWPGYEWMQTLDAAALGDYSGADAALDAIRSGVRDARQQLGRELRQGPRAEWGLLPWLLSDPSTFLPAFAARDMKKMADARAELEAAGPVLLAHQADLDVLEGLLALERGDKEEARTAFTAAQQLGARFAGAPVAAAYLGTLNVTDWATGE